MTDTPFFNCLCWKHHAEDCPNYVSLAARRAFYAPAIAAAARKGGDVQQAPGETPQSVIAQRIPPMTSPPIGTDQELPCDHCGKLERQHVAIIGNGLVCPMQGCTFSNSKSRALQSRISEVERFCAIIDKTDDEGFSPEIEQELMDLRAALSQQGKV